MKVLLTGFEPFGGETINPSWEVAKRVSSEGVEGAEIVTALLPTVFGKSINEAVRVIEELKPDLVISLGQAGGSAEITVERVAINISDAGSPDNDNNQPVDIPIIEGGPAAYFSTLPIKAMVEDIRCAGIPARVSNTAGTFVCNHVMYGVLHHIAVRQLPVRAGFIHIPYLPEQAVKHRGAPSMSLSDMTRAIKAAIRAAVDFKKYIAPLFFTKRSRPFRSWRKTYSFYGDSGRPQVI